MRSNYTTNIENKRVISITGDESETFLNNIITNDVKKINSKNSIYSCLLSPQGKVISHFFISKIDNKFLIIIDNYLSNDLIEKLNFYKLRSQVDIKDENLYNVIFTTDENFKFNSILDFEDPRIPNFGKYFISKKNDNLDINLEDNEKYYKLINLNGLIDSIFNQIQGQYFSLELNMQELNAIDFSKGCYVGQENTARMSLKEKISKKLFRLNSESKLSTGEEIFFNKEIIGKIVSENPNFAMIKMSKFNEFNDKDLKTQKDIKVKISKPNWMN